MNWQLFDALGIFLGFSANLALSSVGEFSRYARSQYMTDSVQVARLGVCKLRLCAFRL